jgi:hypothetical protein
MSLTFIDTNKLPHKAAPGQGEMTEVPATSTRLMLQINTSSSI